MPFWLDNRVPVRLTLVSASPRRRELLAKLELPFEVSPSNSPELMDGADGQVLAMLNACSKVERSSFFEDRSRVLLGADTLIAVGETLFFKPEDVESARRMLTLLSGREHHVITGVCLSGPSATPHTLFIRVESVALSKVRFRDLSLEDIQAYLDSGEWEGKAGAYAIQSAGRGLVANLEGDLDNVIGLPTTLIHDLISTHFSHCRFL